MRRFRTLSLAVASGLAVGSAAATSHASPLVPDYSSSQIRVGALSVDTPANPLGSAQLVGTGPHDVSLASDSFPIVGTDTGSGRVLGMGVDYHNAPADLIGLSGTISLSGSGDIQTAGGSIPIPINDQFGTRPAVLTGIQTDRIRITAGGPGRLGATGAPVTLGIRDGESFQVIQPGGIMTVTFFDGGNANGDAVASSARPIRLNVISPFRIATGGRGGLGDIPGVSVLSMVFVPEPSTAILLAAAAGAMGVVAYRRKKSRS